jgi:hypothetical protein
MSVGSGQVVRSARRGSRFAAAAALGALCLAGVGSAAAGSKAVAQEAQRPLDRLERMLGGLRRDADTLKRLANTPDGKDQQPDAGYADPEEPPRADGYDASEEVLPTEPGVMADSWSSDRFSRFSHVLEGEPGPVTLVLEGRSDMPGGETVAVYRADRAGRRQSGWRLFVIATRDGNVATAPFVIPAPGPGETLGRADLLVVVENHSGRRSNGDYRLTVER